MNKKLECENLTLEKCTINYISIANNSEIFIDDCNKICSVNHFPLIFVKLKNYSLDFDEEIYVLPTFFVSSSVGNIVIV